MAQRARNALLMAAPPLPAAGNRLLNNAVSPDPLAEARQQYPILQNLDLGYKFSPKADSGYLEFWPPGEPGVGEHMRPKEFPTDKPGLEVYRPDTRPADIIGDVASHYLVTQDPKIGGYYKQFEQSLDPKQQAILQDQYQYARTNEGENRPFEDWKNLAGLPAYFRGYAFKQWPEEFNSQAYRPEQRQMFDEMVQYLKAPVGQR